MQSRKVIKFVISGGCAAVTELSMFFLFHSIGLWLIASHVISFLCGLGVSFALNKRWVFSRKGEGLSQFVVYVVLALANLLIGSGLLVVLTDRVKISVIISKLSVMVVIAVWNFIIYERIIFKHKPPESAISL